MLNNIILIIATLLATIHVYRHRQTMKQTDIINTFLLYYLVAGVGVVGTIGFISHVFFANQTAEMIGWPIGSPFQFEVGLHDGAWGLLGFLCIFIRGNFWDATGIGWSFFMLGAAYGHIYQMIVHHNDAPYNAGIIIPDLLIPVILLSLLTLRYHARNLITGE